MEEEDDNVPEKLKPTDVEFFKRVLLGESTIEKFGRRTYSVEQGPHLWNNNRLMRMSPRKRTSAPQFGRTNSGVRNIVIMRSRRSWPVAPPRIRRYFFFLLVITSFMSRYFFYELYGP